VSTHWASRELVIEFEQTRPRHNGLISLAAVILEINPEALARRFYRLNKNGASISFTSDQKNFEGKRRAQAILDAQVMK